MTTSEIVQGLRHCGNDKPCSTCSVQLSENEYCCVDMLFRHAAEALEQTSDLVERLRKELEWKDMVIALAQRKQAEAESERDAAIADLKISGGCAVCKYYCTDTTTCCDCTKKKECKCIGCGIRQNNWEWRGLPGAPEEREKA